jgi:FKBP-type peptidyl-prolyl cis-trans isomerase
MLNVGDVAHVVVPGEAAFGSKGRKASPGKRAIPPNATIEVKYSVLSDTFHRLK